ncbi:Cell shape-determining protein MreC [bacterium HR17]|uniref:Cell shape-determining protein MreC n=1 Tax=Candidatus Fervidibacter japonicus TaxID=2035412 RepID=A0A2H5XD67_9BACT|nr:Cell shape-determining protein MreC [bacterium HR17]
MATRRGVTRTDSGAGIANLIKAFIWGAFFAAGVLGVIALSRLALPPVTGLLGAAGMRIVSTATHMWHWGRQWVNTLLSSDDAALRLQRLQRRVAALEAENLYLRRLAEENQRLRTLLDLGQDLRHPYLAAEIVAIGGSNWYRTAIINKGSAEGVTPNAPVLSHRGLAGRVWEVRSHHSVILLLTDRRSAVGVALSGVPRVFGIVKGTGGRWLELVHLSRHITPRRGERLVTSGLGGVFPPDIPVGEVVRVDGRTEPPTVWVRPFAHDRNLHEVIVLTDTPP